MPMKVYSSSLNYPIDIKTTATTMLQNPQQKQTQKEKIELSAASASILQKKEPNNFANKNSKARSYELSNMMNIYDESNPSINSNVQISAKMLPGCFDQSFPSCSTAMASTSGLVFSNSKQDQLLNKDFNVNGLDILHGISKGEHF